MKTTKILLADDHAIVRDGLRRFLEAAGAYQIVAAVGDGHEAVAMTAIHRPDVVIMDLEMPRLNGIEATRQILGNGIPARVIILSMHAGYADITRAMQVGASGYIHKSSASAEITAAITTVLAGKRYLSPKLVNEHAQTVAWAGTPVDLSQTQNHAF